MEKIEDYLSQTKSALIKIFEAYYSYYELLQNPARPMFTYPGDFESEETKIAFDKWQIENKEILEERHQRDNKFAFEFLARSMLCGSILQFAYNGIKIFSNNVLVPEEFKNIIKPNSVPAKFCIGRSIEEIPIGLIIYAGRNQAMHYEEDNLKEPNKTIFYKLANWYSEKFKKWYVNSYFDLNDKNIVHYAENILYKLEWLDYYRYEKDVLEMLK